MILSRDTYTINEIYRSVQGEGARSGSDNVFLRFSGCNMRCSMERNEKSPGGFDCDTEFVSGRKMSIREIISDIVFHDQQGEREPCKWVIATGGEPLLQLNVALVKALHAAGYKVAIETNGSLPTPAGVDYVAVSPKVAEHCVRCHVADEVRYVRGHGQAIPKTRIAAKRYFISPAFSGTTLDAATLQWCKQLIRDNPPWELSIQTHKLDGVR